MSAGDLRQILQLWNHSDQESERKLQKFLLSGMDKIVQAQSDVLTKVKVGNPVSTPVVRWMEEWGYPTYVTGQLASTTLTISGNLFGAAASATTVKQVIREGTILERQGDGVQIKVSDVGGLSSAPFTCTVAAYGNTTLSDDTGPVTWEIISEVWSDYKDAGNPRSLDRRFREVGTQIHAETFEIPWTRKNTKYELVGNEVEHQIKQLLEKLRRQIAYAVLRSRPNHDGNTYVYGNKTQEPTMCGICTWPVITQGESANANVYINTSGAGLTKEDLDGLALHLMLDEFANYNQGDWWIVCHPLVHKYIHDFDISYRRMEKGEKAVGFTVDEFNAKIGKTFPILADRYMRPDTLILVNLKEFEYGYYSNDQMTRKQIATDGRYDKWLITFQTYGTVARNPRGNVGMIYGIGTG